MEIWLSNGTTDKIQIPVNPQSFGANDSSNFEDIVLANGDEKTVISGRNLKTYNIASFFPKQRGSYVTSVKLLAPMDYVKKIQSWMDGRKVLQLQATKTNVNTRVTIRSFDWEEKGGSVGDIEYTLELKEYKPISFTKLSTSTPGKKPSTSNKSRPPANKPQPKTHLVKSGDSLWKIAQIYYKNGSQWSKIYNANKKVIGSNPNLIRPGQKLVIP